MFAFDAIGQQAVVADTPESVGQDVLQKAANELGGGEFVRFESVIVLAVPVAVDHTAAVTTHQAVIADGRAMGVASQRVQQFAWSGKGGFRIDDPRFVPEAFEPAVAEIGLFKLGELRRAL